jgi:hypothetical protein
LTSGVMRRLPTRKLAVTAAVLLAVAGGGAAFAATQLGSPKEESQAVVEDAAKQLGVDPGKLDDALRTALANRIDRAVAAGELTKEQGDALKARIQSADTPLFGGRPGFGRPGRFGHVGPAGDFSVAATYLGVTEAELITALHDGKSLADVAKEKGKSVDGLVDALVAAVEKKLDAAVTAGRLTDARRKELVADLKERVTAFVNGEFRRGFRPALGLGPRFGPAFGFRFRDGDRGERRSSFRVFS